MLHKHGLGDFVVQCSFGIQQLPPLPSCSPPARSPLQVSPPPSHVSLLSCCAERDSFLSPALRDQGSFRTRVVF